MAITFFIDATPIAQPRQRHAMIDGHVTNYIPAKHPVQAFKKIVRIRAREAHTGAPLTGPIHASFKFLLPRPKRLVWKSKAMPRCWSTGHIDLDNLFKSTADAMTGIIWADDAQVCYAEIRKMYVCGNDQPGVEVYIEEFEKE